MKIFTHYLLPLLFVCLISTQMLKAEISLTGDARNEIAGKQNVVELSQTTVQGDDVIDGSFIMNTLYPVHLRNIESTVHFEWPGGNPLRNSWIIYFNAALFDGISLEAGDEIAIFDKTQNKIVGANVLTAAPVPGTFQQYVVAFEQLANQTSGYFPGNEFELRCWDASGQIESIAFEADFLNPFGDAYMPANSDFPFGAKQYSIAAVDFFPVLCPDDLTVCESDNPFELTGALPEGGEYSGNGVVDEFFFDPSVAGVGLQTITYAYTNPFNSQVYTCEFTIDVIAPEVTCPEDFVVCCDSDAFELSGATPEGGTYFLDGEPVTIFQPDCANTGDFQITYEYTDPQTGCENSCSFTITVNPLPEVTCPEDFAVCCDSDAFELSGATPEGGTYYTRRWYLFP